MRGGRSLIAPSSDEFCLPHEVFKLGLEHSPLLVYLYLICSKSRKRGADKMSCAAISKAVSLCEKTVRTHLRTLADAGFIKMEHHGRTFSYSLCPIQSKVQEHRSTTRWISKKQAWNTDEVFDAVFPVPAEVFQLDLECGELLVYIYLHYQKGVRSGQCWPSYATIGKAVGMSRKTVQKHVGSPVNRGLIRVEDPPKGWSPLQRQSALYGQAHSANIEGTRGRIPRGVKAGGSPAEMGSALPTA